MKASRTARHAGCSPRVCCACCRRSRHRPVPRRITRRVGVTIRAMPRTTMRARATSWSIACRVAAATSTIAASRTTTAAGTGIGLTACGSSPWPRRSASSSTAAASLSWRRYRWSAGEAGRSIAVTQFCLPRAHGLRPSRRSRPARRPKVTSSGSADHSTRSAADPGMMRPASAPRPNTSAGVDVSAANAASHGRPCATATPAPCRTLCAVFVPAEKCENMIGTPRALQQRRVLHRGTELVERAGQVEQRFQYHGYLRPGEQGRPPARPVHRR